MPEGTHAIRRARRYLPDSLLFASGGPFAALVPFVARAIATTGPASTLLIEAVVPALHALDPKRWPRCALAGVAFTLAFHAVIGLTPPPSNVSTYGTAAEPRPVRLCVVCLC